MTHAYFEYVKGLYEPHKTARSPWSREQQSGLAVAGLLARVIEGAPSLAPLRIARLTVDFLGAVPMKSTEVRAEILRDGGGVQVVEAWLVVDGAPAARATGLRICEQEGPSANLPTLGFAGPGDAPFVPIAPYLDAGHPLETRIVQRATPEGAPGVCWSRFHSEFIAGESASPIIRACMCADIATGPAATASSRGWRTPNADLSLYFAREPRGEWLLGVSQMAIAADGIGLTRTTLGDEQGVYGYACQTLVFSRRTPVV